MSVDSIDHLLSFLLPLRLRLPSCLNWTLYFLFACTRRGSCGALFRTVQEPSAWNANGILLLHLLRLPASLCCSGEAPRVAHRAFPGPGGAPVSRPSSEGCCQGDMHAPPTVLRNGSPAFPSPFMWNVVLHSSVPTFLGSPF